MNASSVRVVLCDDHLSVRVGVRRLLEAFDDIDLVASVADGEEGVRATARLRPDVVLMDLSMPGIDGVQATRRILAGMPATRVVVLTSFSGRERVLEAIDAGATGRRRRRARVASLGDASGRPSEPVDARIYEDVLWVLRHYGLRVSAARDTGHHTHGDGTALDLVPAIAASQADWGSTAGRLAHDLGWTETCGPSGARPQCALKPAIQWIGYDGYPSHGSPRTCTGGCPAHIHVSWASGCYGSRALVAPCRWVMAFPVPTESDDGPGAD